jgi:hypothetical protein
MDEKLASFSDFFSAFTLFGDFSGFSRILSMRQKFRVEAAVSLSVDFLSDTWPVHDGETTLSRQRHLHRPHRGRR